MKPSPFALLLLLFSTALAQSPQDGRRGFELAELKLTLDSPGDLPLRFLEKDEFRLDLNGTVCEFVGYDHGQKAGPFITGMLLHQEGNDQSAGDFAATVMDMYRRSEAPERVDLVSERKLDRKPGEWVMREYKVTQFDTPMRHIVIGVRDGDHNYGLLLITPGSQDEKVSLSMTDRIVGTLSVGGVPGPGVGGSKGGEKPLPRGEKPLPGDAVAGLVFSNDRDRDLFLLKDGETTPRNITNSPGWDCQPDWSWDGKRIAFLSGRASNNRDTGWTDGIYVMNADGSGVVKVTPGEQNDLKQPRFSGDGTRIVYSGGHDFGNGRQQGVIQTIKLDGTGHRALTGAGEKADAPDWSPDGNRIVYTGWTERAEGLYVMNPDGSGKTCIVPATRLGATGERPRWSADGRTIVFTGPPWQEVPRATWHTPWGATFLVNPDGTNLRWNHLTHDSLPVMLPKGCKVAFIATHGGDYRKDGNAINVYVKNVNGPHTLQVTKNMGDVQEFDYSPASADEPLPIPALPYDIVFARRGGEVGSFDIFVMTEHGKDVADITQTCTYYAEENNPSWSPDKKKILFDSDAPYWVDGEMMMRSDNTRNIYVMDADGSNRVNLTRHHGLESHPVWSPDGTTIAFQRGVNGGFAVFLMDAVSATVVRTNSPLIPPRQMTWSNDSLTLVVSGDQGARLLSADITAPTPTWTKIERGAGFDPDWNPVEDPEIGYFGWNAREKFALQRFDFPGGMDADIAEMPDGANPSWGPDGYRIAFDTGGSGNSDILIANKNHPGILNAVNITKGFGGRNVQPDWAAGPHAAGNQPPKGEPVAAKPGTFVLTGGKYRVETTGDAERTARLGWQFTATAVVRKWNTTIDGPPGEEDLPVTYNGRLDFQAPPDRLEHGQKFELSLAASGDHQTGMFGEWKVFIADAKTEGVDVVSLDRFHGPRPTNGKLTVTMPPQGIYPLQGFRIILRGDDYYLHWEYEVVK